MVPLKTSPILRFRRIRHRSVQSSRAARWILQNEGWRFITKGEYTANPLAPRLIFFMASVSGVLSGPTRI